MRWLAHDAVLRVAYALRPFLYPRALRTASRGVVEGIEVYALAPERIDDHLLEVVRKAIHLIRLYDPRRWARIRTDVDHFVIRDMGRSNGLFLPGIAGMQLSPRVFDDPAGAKAAVTIVHEAIHARLDRAGISQRPWVLDRIERRCVLEQMGFIGRLLRPPAARRWIMQFAATTDLTHDQSVTSLIDALRESDPAGA